MSDVPPEPMAGLVAALPKAAGDAEPAEEEYVPEVLEPLDVPLQARRLLKIRVPVRVTLAAQRKPIQEIIELGPGSIVKFDKTCDEPLELTVGDHPIAIGDVVKVGDKFGLRIAWLIRPSDRTFGSI